MSRQFMQFWQRSRPWRKGAMVGFVLSIFAAIVAMYGAVGQLLFHVVEGYEGTLIWLFLLGWPLSRLGWGLPSLPLLVEIAVAVIIVVIQWTMLGVFIGFLIARIRKHIK